MPRVIGESVIVYSYEGRSIYNRRSDDARRRRSRFVIICHEITADLVRVLGDMSSFHDAPNGICERPFYFTDGSKNADV